MKNNLQTKYSVYLIKDLKDKILYVGCTKDPSRRLKQHTTWPPSTGHGKFYKQQIKMEIYRVFDDRLVANWYEGYLKYKFGFRDEIITDLGYLGKLTIKENSLKGLHKRSMKVKAFEYKTGKLIGEYPSQHEASRQLDVPQPHITYIINNTREQSKGYYFEKSS